MFSDEFCKLCAMIAYAVRLGWRIVRGHGSRRFGLRDLTWECDEGRDMK